LTKLSFASFASVALNLLLDVRQLLRQTLALGSWINRTDHENRRGLRNQTGRQSGEV